MISRRIYRHRRGRNLLTALAALSVVSGTLLVATTALAVHDDGFMQLDRNALTSLQSTPPATDDWDNVYNRTDSADASRFVTDGPLATIFTGGGSKDDLNVTGWRHKGGSVPDKDDLLDGFAAIYGDLLYFGADRVDGSGTATLGVWFFQGNVGPLANGTFSGTHVDGDILVLTDFQASGANATVRIYEWMGGANGAPVFLAGSATAPADCVGSPSVPLGDPYCGTTNAANTPAPWPFAPKNQPVGIFAPGLFFEGGIDLAALGLGDQCFSTFLLETRTSNTLNSQLKDFVAGQLESCGSTTVTTPSAGSDGAVSIGTGSVNVSDSAVITVTGTATFGGTVTFSLCGPTPLANASYTLCTTGGTQIGSPVTVSGSGGTSTVPSASAAVTSAGRYCWRADYSGDATVGVPASSDSSVTECFRVTPVNPTLTTNATASVNLGSPISDSATLGGTSNKPGTPIINPTTAGAAAGGTITFRAYGPNDATCTGTPAFTSSAVTVSGNDPYSSGNFTPLVAGTYKWIATYSGDSPNTNSKAGACDDANETSVVISLQPSMTTAQRFTPNDSATVTVASGGGDLAGNVRFRLFVNNATCTGTADYDSGSVAISSGTGTGLSRTVSSSNTTAYATTGTTFSWLVTYTSTNAGHTNVTATCNAENSSITIANGGTFNTP